jgi:alkylhydroperoxidase family enzyme
VTQAVLADWRTAPVDDRLRATLGFLEKMTLRPEELTHSDAQAVRDAGVAEEALLDAIHVCALFNMIVRMADSLGFEPPGPEYLERGAPRMLASGYALA